MEEIEIAHANFNETTSRCGVSLKLNFTDRIPIKIMKNHRSYNVDAVYR